MRLVRLLVLTLLATGTSVVAAQIPTRRPTQTQAASARILVGNPHTFNARDSVSAVAIGEGIRLRMDKISGRDFRVLSRADMNEALVQFGYPADAILSALPARNLGQALNARLLLVSTLTRNQAGLYTVTSRLAGINDDAGNVVTLTQAASQPLGDLGGKVGDGFAPALKAFSDAKACVDLTRTEPEKAAAAAKRALTTMPRHGLANYCLGQLALARGRRADSTEAMQYFQAAVTGDPLSLAAWTQLAAGREAAGDTLQTIEALKQMLRIAPTNQPLRELAFKKFLSYGKPEIAEEVANDGLELDPTNIDLLELRANARIFRENYSGALDDLEQIIALDSTRADSTFYVKFLVTASQKPDTARLVRWSSQGLRKFPDNLTILQQVTGAYSQLGLSDSLLGAMAVLLRVDSASAVGLALQEAKTRQDNKMFAEAMPFIDFAARHGDAQAREGAAGLLLNGTLPLLQPPQQDFQGAAAGLRRVVQLADPAGRYAPIASHFLGLSLVNIISGLDTEAEKQKSCDLARQVEAHTTEAEAALAAASSYTAQVDARTRLLQYLAGLKPRTASMIRVYCK